jgi:transcriptional regulator with XRE-family HTH domain
MTQDELASATGVAQKTIARFETGAVVPHDRTLRDLQRALEEMGVEFLFDGSKGVGVRVSANASGRTDKAPAVKSR